MTSLVLLTLMSFSQTGTDTTKKVIAVPVATMRNMIKEIVRGDECQEEKKVLNDNISILNSRVKSRDSIIVNEKILTANVELQLKNEQTVGQLNNLKLIQDDAVIASQDKAIKSLNKSLKWQKVKQVALGAAVVAAAVKIFIFK